MKYIAIQQSLCIPSNNKRDNVLWKKKDQIETEEALKQLDD